MNVTGNVFVFRVVCLQGTCERVYNYEDQLVVILVDF